MKTASGVCDKEWKVSGDGRPAPSPDVEASWVPNESRESSIRDLGSPFIRSDGQYLEREMPRVCSVTRTRR
jgi:hypothetical protein